MHRNIRKFPRDLEERATRTSTRGIQHINRQVSAAETNEGQNGS